jgi:hypothetical protein
MEIMEYFNLTKTKDPFESNIAKTQSILNYSINLNDYSLTNHALKCYGTFISKHNCVV